MSAPDDATRDRTPAELREDIAHTREALGDTVEALAEKSDVKRQARDRAAALKQAAQEKAEDFTSRARDASPDSATAGAQQVVSTVQRTPVPFVALGAFASGVVAGWILGRR